MSSPDGTGLRIEPGAPVEMTSENTAGKVDPNGKERLRPNTAPYSAFARSRSSTRRILPEIVFGSSGTKAISRGYL